MLNRLLGALGLGQPGEPPAPEGEPVEPPFGPAAPSRARVLMIVHNPPVESQRGRRLTELFGWHDPDALARQYIADLHAASHGFLNYEIVERISADWYPPKIDGFRYTNDSFIRAWQTRTLYEPNAIDYPAQVRAFDLIQRYNRGDFEEVWFFSFPYAGDYESTMVGRGAFWCNSPPVTGTDGCQGRFVMMAFNYERGVDCMLENYGHRAESILSRVYQTLGRGRNMWELFIQHERTAPGLSQCGNVHFAPNSERDYDWGNRRPVRSFCDDWYSYPILPGRARTVDCREWGHGDMRAHHLWWFQHFPHFEGETDGVSNNWWRYVLDPNLVP
ncbi:MAG: hypothetical protein OHK0022_52620 [Roseiflexaceae bacterium]